MSLFQQAHLHGGILFLFYDMVIIFSNSRTGNPASYWTLSSSGNTWECLNSICTEYRKKTITRCDRKLKVSGGTSVTTTFKCLTCGFTYSKRWNSGRTEAKKPLVVSMGHLWNEKVETMYLAGYTQYKIHTETGFSEAAIKTCINKLKKRLSTLSNYKQALLPTEILQAIHQVSATTIDDTRETYRSTLLQAARINQTNKRLFMLRKHPREYNWLCKNDSAWMDEHFPRKRVFKPKLELHAFDELLARKIKSIAEELKDDSNSQVRKFSILNRLSPMEKSRFVSFKEDRLPASYEAMKESIEDLDSYLIRSVSRAIAKLRNSGYQTISFAALISYSRLYESCDPRQKKKIEEILRQYNEVNIKS